MTNYGLPNCFSSLSLLQNNQDGLYLKVRWEVLHKRENCEEQDYKLHFATF